MSGEERRSDVYWRWSCDLRNSGRLWDGGCVEGNRRMGGTEVVRASIEGAGVMAAAVAAEAHRHCREGARDDACIAFRNCLGWSRSRGGGIVFLGLRTEDTEVTEKPQ